MQAKIENGQLIITIPVNAQPVLSSTGKSKLVASTGGFMATTAVVDGKPIKVNLTAIVKP